LLEHFNWELFDNPPYSPDLSPSGYHLFTYLKNWLGLQSFNNNEELMEGVKMWLSLQAADFFDTGIQKLIRRYKCLSSGSGYVEKLLKYVCVFFFLYITTFNFSLLDLLTLTRGYLLNSPCT
jgi:hypothetical protein